MSLSHVQANMIAKGINEFIEAHELATTWIVKPILAKSTDSNSTVLLHKRLTDEGLPPGSSLKNYQDYPEYFDNARVPDDLRDYIEETAFAYCGGLGKNPDALQIKGVSQKTFAQLREGTGA